MISNSFFAGLESFMEDDKVEASATVTVAPEEQVAEEAEAEQAATEQEETTAEIEQEEQAAEMIFAKFEEIDRMIAHVETYGVDRSFLSICNHDNVLGNSFGIALPACESFDAVGDPNSIASQEALEGLKDAARKVWEFIKRMCARLIMFLQRLIKLVPVRLALLKRKIKKLEEVKAEDHQKTSETDGKYYKVEDFSTKLATMEANAKKGLSVKLPKVEPSGDLKGATYAQGTEIVADVKTRVATLESFLKDLPKTMKEISDLNMKVAKAERSGNKDEAVTLKDSVKSKQQEVSVASKALSFGISICNKALKGAAAIFAATKGENSEKKTK